MKARRAPVDVRDKLELLAQKKRARDQTTEPSTTKQPEDKRDVPTIHTSKSLTASAARGHF